MEPIYTLDPEKWVAYRSTHCPLCGQLNATGEHRQFFTPEGQDLPVWGCRVPMTIQNPASCGVIDYIAP